jgi:hypothetical protein
MNNQLGRDNAFSEVYRRSVMGELVRRCHLYYIIILYYYYLRHG